MEFRVVIKLEEGLEWPEEIVDAEDKWDALVQVAEGLGLDKRITMSQLWKKASISKMHRKLVSKLRKEKEEQV